MRLVIALVMLALCACAKSGAGAPVQWPARVQCPASVDDLIATVSRILVGAGPPEQRALGEAARAELEAQARRHGSDKVVCMIERLASDWSAPDAAQEPLRLAAAARGRNFLQTVGVSAQLSTGSEP